MHYQNHANTLTNQPLIGQLDHSNPLIAAVFTAPAFACGVLADRVRTRQNPGQLGA